MDWRLFEVEPGCALEQAVIDHPRDREAWAVLADFVSDHSPRLGERIMLELDGDGSEAHERVRAFDHRHRREWIDPGLARLFDRRGEAPEGVDLDWRYGFIFGLRLDGGTQHDESGLDSALSAVLESPLSRFMARLSVDLGTRPEHEREGVRALIRASQPRPALTEIRYRDHHGLTQIEELVAWAPRLERLHVHGRLRLDALDHAQLRELSLHSHEETLPRSARPLVLPRLVSLALVSRGSGDHDDYEGTLGRRLRTMLDGAELSALESLSLEAPGAGEWSVLDLCVLGVIQRLQTLAVPNSGFGPIAAAGLGTLWRRGELPRLERLIVPGHDMHPGSLRMLRSQHWDVVVD